MDEDALAAYLEGALSTEEALAVRGHLDRCGSCHQLSAAVGRAFLRGPASGTLSSASTEVDLARALEASSGPPRLDAGTTLGRYVIQKTLGSGGMGVVYAAWDPDLHRTVALKVVVSIGDDVATHRKRLLREARLAAQLQHANVVTVFDVGELEDATYLAMELVRGHSLRAYVGDTTLTTEIRITWLKDVARALAAAHQQGLVHRDIKPENVMLREDGVIKVVDFGIARPIGAEAAAGMGSGTLTSTGVVVGTPLYMSPEQLRNGVPDARSDQFAWAVLAFELLTGRRPWKETGIALVSEILTVAPPPLISQGLVLPASVIAAVSRAIAKDPADRFSSMTELVEALEAERGPVDRTAPTPIVSRTRLVAIGGVGLVLAASLAVSVAHDRQPAREGSVASGPPTPAAAKSSEGRVSPEWSEVPHPSALPAPPLAVSTPATVSASPPPRRPVATVAASASSVPASPPKSSCNPPYSWVAGVKVPKPECPLD